MSAIQLKITGKKSFPEAIQASLLMGDADLKKTLAVVSKAKPISDFYPLFVKQAIMLCYTETLSLCFEQEKFKEYLSELDVEARMLENVKPGMDQFDWPDNPFYKALIALAKNSSDGLKESPHVLTLAAALHIDGYSPAIVEQFKGVPVEMIKETRLYLQRTMDDLLAIGITDPAMYINLALVKASSGSPINIDEALLKRMPPCMIPICYYNNLISRELYDRVKPLDPFKEEENKVLFIGAAAREREQELTEDLKTETFYNDFVKYKMLKVMTSLQSLQSIKKLFDDWQEKGLGQPTPRMIATSLLDSPLVFRMFEREYPDIGKIADQFFDSILEKLEEKEESSIELVE